jgi:integrase
MSKIKLTAKTLNLFSTQAQERDKVWDSELKGFHVLKLKTGISFRLFYRNAEGKQKTITLGSYPAITADQARKLTLESLGRIASGEDVQEAKQGIKTEAANRHVQTLGAYIDDIYIAYQKRKKSGEQTISTIKKHFPAWLPLPMGSISPKDVRRWQAEKETQGLHHETIKRTFGALKTCLNHAVKTGTIEAHQLTGCQLDKPHLTEEELGASGTGRRFMSDEETILFFNGIEAYQEEKRRQRRNTLAHGKPSLPDLDSLEFADHVKPWIMTMYYTGLRPGDLFGLRWDQVNLDFRTIRKTIEKTAHHQPEPRTFPISHPLISILKSWKKQNGNPATGYVFPSARTGGRMDKTSMQKPWRKIKDLSGLPSDMDLYTLRHNFASLLILLGADLLTVSKLMGHTDIQTTIKHYGHLKPDMARDYVDLFASKNTPEVIAAENDVKTAISRN